MGSSNNRLDINPLEFIDQLCSIVTFLFAAMFFAPFLANLKDFLAGEKAHWLIYSAGLIVTGSIMLIAVAIDFDGSDGTAYVVGSLGRVFVAIMRLAWMAFVIFIVWDRYDVIASALSQGEQAVIFLAGMATISMLHTSVKLSSSLIDLYRALGT